jgi:hypothetical protein
MNYGKIAYEAYCTHTGWKSLISGQQLPPWDKLDPKIREAWEAAGQAIARSKALQVESLALRESGVGLTTDGNNPCLYEIKENGQQECYLILSDEERKKGFVRPVRRTYTHVKCGTTTTMAQAIAETYARDPKFYGGTFCCHCKKHFLLVTSKSPQFLWEDGSPVGS